MAKARLEGDGGDESAEVVWRGERQLICRPGLGIGGQARSAETGQGKGERPIKDRDGGRAGESWSDDNVLTKSIIAKTTRPCRLTDTGAREYRKER